ASGQAGTLDDLDHLIDVLVGKRRLLGEAAVGRAADDDPLGLELAAKLRAADPLPRSGATEQPPGAVTDGSERALHRPRASGEHVARGAHAPGDEDRLADLAVLGRDVERARWEGACGALAMDPQVAVAVPLALDDIVRDVV